MSWTDERTALLKKLWAEGLSASQIAAELGIESRNAVIGKARRLGLGTKGQATSQPRQPKPSRIASQGFHGYRPGRQLPTPRPGPISSAPASIIVAGKGAPTFRAPLPSEPEPPMESASFRCTLLDLADESCRWPIGDPWKPEFRFCGAPGADFAGRRPYCPCHQRMAWARAA